MCCHISEALNFSSIIPARSPWAFFLPFHLGCGLYSCRVLFKGSQLSKAPPEDAFNVTAQQQSRPHLEGSFKCSCLFHLSEGSMDAILQWLPDSLHISQTFQYGCPRWRDNKAIGGKLHINTSLGFQCRKILLKLDPPISLFPFYILLTAAPLNGTYHPTL